MDLKLRDMKSLKFLSASATIFLNDYQKEMAIQANYNEETYQSLKYLLIALKIEDKQFIVSEGLEYWREQFNTRIFQYQGDAQYYAMFSRSIKKGLSLKEALCEVKGIIDREINILEKCYLLNIPYSLNLY